MQGPGAAARGLDEASCSWGSVSAHGGDLCAPGDEPGHGRQFGARTQAGDGPALHAQLVGIVHQVRDGDSLPSIAYDAYGDPTRWRPIAEANGIDNPLSLRRGSELTIPTLD